MSFYEHTFVAKQDLSTIEVDDLETKYNDLINSTDGKVVKIEKWGLLSFAKKINNYNRGFYIHYKFEGNSKTIGEIKKKTNLDNSIIRHLTIKYKKLDTEKEYFKKEDQVNEKKK
jgi:small subunit ribosomal protein S6